MVKQMARTLSIFLSVALLAALTACGDTSSNRQSAYTPPAASQGNQEPAESGPNTESDENSDGTGTDAAGSNILVAYFSLAGEQYAVGVIEEGNTSIIAHMIAEQTGADLFEIEPVTPYPETHSGLLEVSQEEMSSNARPEFTGMVENIAEYDTIFIG